MLGEVVITSVQIYQYVLSKNYTKFETISIEDLILAALKNMYFVCACFYDNFFVYTDS